MTTDIPLSVRCGHCPWPATHTVEMRLRLGRWRYREVCLRCARLHYGVPRHG